jgi:16S rRNA (guanine(966)-N(2))-methyltransferase RsmD
VNKISGSNFLDLFSGSGAIGIEAKSRGASQVIFVDNNKRAIRLILQNLSLCGFNQGCHVYLQDALRALDELEKKGNGFDLIFLDPPYDSDLPEKVLEVVSQKDLLNPGGEVVAEHSARSHLAEDYGRLRLRGTHRFGDTRLSIYG